MKIIGVIPSRYASGRFPGKPIADICGKPMVWWIYQQLLKVPELSEVYVATDDERIANVCKDLGLNYLMTNNSHKTHIERLWEVSEKIQADFYININGDEPLITHEVIRKVLPGADVDSVDFYVSNLMTEVKNPVEIADTSKIKIAVDSNSFGMYMGRYPIPFPKGRPDVIYNKFVGVQCFTKAALDFSMNTARGYIESCEDIDEYRFLENGKKIKFIKVESDNVSVDTPKDLEKVRDIIAKKDKGGLELWQKQKF